MFRKLNPIPLSFILGSTTNKNDERTARSSPNEFRFFNRTTSRSISAALFFIGSPLSQSVGQEDYFLLAQTSGIGIGTTIPTTSNTITGFEFRYGGFGNNFGSAVENHFSFGQIRVTLDDVGKTFVITRGGDPEFRDLTQQLTDGKPDLWAFRTYALADGFTALNWTPDDEAWGASTTSITGTRLRYPLRVGFQNDTDLEGLAVGEIHLTIDSASITVNEENTSVSLAATLSIYGRQPSDESFDLFSEPDLKIGDLNEDQITFETSTEIGGAYQLLTSADLVVWEGHEPFIGTGQNFQTSVNLESESRVFAKVRYLK